MKLIAIVGMTGAGKSELAKLFEKKGYANIRFGDITEEILKKKGLDINEENEKSVRNSLRKEYGMEAYAKANLEKVEQALKAGNVVIDGLYSWEEFVFLKQKFKDLIVLAVYSPPEMRYDRLVDREVRSLTKEQARKRDKDELENLNKAAPIAMANYTMVNVGTLFDLEEKFNSFMEWMKEEGEK